MIRLEIFSLVPTSYNQCPHCETLYGQAQISAQLSRRFLGKRVRVLVEGPSKKPHLNAAENDDNPQLVGRTETDWIVVFNAPPSYAGQFTRVRINKVTPLTLFGVLD